MLVSPSPSANAANPQRRIDTVTPPVLRAQQTMDMLNRTGRSAGRVATLARPARSTRRSHHGGLCGTGRSPSTV
ncbi:lpqF domain protein [Mycobacterium ulcerans str. Harvey]|uniref:LpqF domain protein n=1 Tax=Mycobacterium ulcerans str. Harvey TaxID=1299332 RepID=A0ABN0R9V6_MYCUL|nr:lpqF domain protein [Mycobacterium ulcerans str. Harvey]